MSLPLLRQPAGLSSDTLGQPTNQRHAIQDDQWSAHDTAESDDEQNVMEESIERQEDLAIQANKLSTATTDKTHEVGSPSPLAPSPNAAQDATNHEADSSSVHSLPVVQVTEHSNSGPMTSRSASAAYPSSPTASLAPTASSSLDRRSRHRATLDVSTLPETPGSRADCNRPVHQTVYLVSSQTSYIDETTYHRRCENRRHRLHLP